MRVETYGLHRYEIAMTGDTKLPDIVAAKSITEMHDILKNFNVNHVLAWELLNATKRLANSETPDEDTLMHINYIVEHYNLFYSTPIIKALEITRRFFDILHGEELAQTRYHCSKSAIETEERILQLINDLRIEPDVESTTHSSNITVFIDDDLLQRMEEFSARCPFISFNITVKQWHGDVIHRFKDGHEIDNTKMDELRELLHKECSSLCIEPSLFETSNGTMVRHYSIVKQKEEMK